MCIFYQLLLAYCVRHDYTCTLQERAIAGAKEMMKTGKRTEEPDDKSSDSENLATDDTSDPRSVAQ